LLVANYKFACSNKDVIIEIRGNYETANQQLASKENVWIANYEILRINFCISPAQGAHFIEGYMHVRKYGLPLTLVRKNKLRLKGYFLAKIDFK
jgi:hypothetical protein